MRLLDRPCKICGKEFRPRSKNHKYCGKYCAAKANKEKLKQHERGRLVILDRDNYTCIYCGRTSYRDNARLTLDHISALDNGGQNTAKNLVTSCHRCNMEKGTTQLYSQEIILGEVERRNKKAGIHPDRTIKCRATAKRKRRGSWQR